jgi:hypothetical protein
MSEPTPPSEPTPSEVPAVEQYPQQDPEQFPPQFAQQPPPYPPYPQAPAVARPRFRDRVLGMRGVAAVAVAGLILGGAGGAVLGAATSGGEDHNFGPGRGGFGGPGQFQQQLPPQGQGQPPQGFQGFPGGQGGQLPPGTAPQNPVQPDNSGDTPGGAGGSNT